MSAFDASAAAAAAAAPKSFKRRDDLRANEIAVQKKWAEEKVFEVDPEDGREKFFLNFPYPYMNGRLHLGHAFSLTKAEFTARFQRLQGKNVLFPFGFHCTGMPIQAAAKKLRDELQQFGCPPVFPSAAAEEEEEKPEKEEVSAEAAQANKSKGKKTKLLVKGATGTPMRQWEIMSKMVPQNEIGEFADPMKWLNYFPAFGVTDLQAFGSAIDWRRSFITTSVNPFYDAFIRWQFNRLQEGGRIKFGKRPNVFSPGDGQVCADHDRASGEGVGPQEYTLVKLLVKQPYPEGSPLNAECLVGRNIYLAPATLRPETMYGQTNCFLLPEGDYGAYELKNGDVFVISQRSALNMAHQDYMKDWGKCEALVTMKGQALLGLGLKAPLAQYETVYTLPLLTISMGKGTGVVTSVPSDAPDDYAALKELKDKPLWREKFGLTSDMVDPFDVVPIIDIPGYGNMAAVTMCERLDIKSSKDKEKLKLAKDEVYLKGFNEGVMLVGQYAGMKVKDAKPLVRQKLIDSGEACAYFEPENLVMSRSGDECVVALCDQWYLSYGDEQWVNLVKKHIHSERFNGYNDRIMEKFDQVLDWLGEWACSRQFGLGTLLPWDQKWVIESLSDSTIYMAYYTIAHYLQGSVDNLNGDKPSPAGIKPEDLTDDVFSYIFLHKDLPAGVTSAISTDLLNKMRHEFEYWYPVNLRVSAKDLIPNHLTMCLYNHAEIWKDSPEMWPRGIYCNGHIMVDAEKMAKSKGNFLMMLECVEDFTADATRFTLADAGDSMEDANFDRAVCNNAISYLYVEDEFCTTVLREATEGMLRTGPLTFMDECFNNEIDNLVEATFTDFEKMCYRDGIHRCWFDMIIARDFYRDWSKHCNMPFHVDVITRFVHALCVMMAPITPHWSEKIWGAIAPFEGKSSTVCDAKWPVWQPYDRSLRKQYMFFRKTLKSMHLNLSKTKLVKGQPIHAYLYYATHYDAQKIEVLEWLQTQYNADANTFPEDLLMRMKTWCEEEPERKKATKLVMQFGAFMKGEALERGADALATTMAYDQGGIMEENRSFVANSLEVSDLQFINISEEGVAVPGDKKSFASCVPGKPSSQIFNPKVAK